MAFLYGVAFILCCGLQGVLLVTNPVRIVKRLARFGNDNQGHGKWSMYLFIINHVVELGIPYLLVLHEGLHISSASIESSTFRPITCFSHEGKCIFKILIIMKYKKQTNVHQLFLLNIKINFFQPKGFKL